MKAACILDVIEFLASPSRRTLRDVIDDGSLAEEQVNDELRALESALNNGYAHLPEVPEKELENALAGEKKRQRAIAAVMHEESDLTPSEIGRRLGLSRSQVYAAVDWYRRLEDPMRAAVAIAVWPEAATQSRQPADSEGTKAGPAEKRSPACRPKTKTKSRTQKP